MKKYYTRPSILVTSVLVIFVTTVNPFSYILGETNGIHYRMGFSDIGDGSTRTYKFQDVDKYIGFINAFPIEIIREKLENNNIESWDIDFQIFESVEDAELAMVELLDMSNLYIDNIIDIPLSDGSIGDNCWYSLSMGVVRFIRNNVLINIGPRNQSIEVTNAEWLAREIDEMLVKSNKVEDKNLIHTPIIHSVEVLSKSPVKWDDIVEIKVIATDKNNQKLYYRKYATGFSCVSENGILTLPLYDKTDKIEGYSNAKVKIWVWNEDFITSSIQADIPF